jgi:hypothetical protein
MACYRDKFTLLYFYFMGRRQQLLTLLHTFLSASSISCCCFSFSISSLCLSVFPEATHLEASSSKLQYERTQLQASVFKTHTTKNHVHILTYLHKG